VVGVLVAGAVAVGPTPAPPAHDVVVVVPDTCLVASRRPGRLDAPDETLLAEQVEGVVDGLTRDGAQLCVHDAGDVVGAAVGPLGDGPQHGDALGGDLDATGSQQLSRFGRDVVFHCASRTLLGVVDEDDLRILDSL